MRAVVLSALLLLALTGCGGSDVTAESGRFVGQTSSGNAFIAVNASAPTGSGSSRLVRAFVTDGTAVNEWFSGTVNGNIANLSSEDGDSQLSGFIFGDHAEGTVTLAGGQTLSFSVGTASGIAGLYDVTIENDGTITGSSGASTLTAVITSTVQDSRYVVAGTISAGTAVVIQTLVTADAIGDHRWIVLSSSAIKGGVKQGQGEGFAGDVTD